MLLVAVSGGIDSMCLSEKVRLEGGPFAIAHCNFGLRGVQSDGDEVFVREWARAHGITCHVKHFDTQAFATAEGISIEMAARRLRYHWFGELCREFGYRAVAVAHNANDNAETLLLNLLRGTGLRGITGMKPSGFLPDPEFGDIPLLRPLLGMTRADIEAFAAEHGLRWREDVTNASNEFKRNKLRNLVFPVFEEINPRFVETLNRNMERFAREMSEWDFSPQTVGFADPSHKWAPPVPGENFSPSCPPRDICPSGPAEGGHGFAEKSPIPNNSFEMAKEEWDGTGDVKQPEGVLILDADKAGEFTEGRWESGDWIRPLGAPGKKKMQDWFTDHHIPAHEKPFVPLLKSTVDPHHILAVVPWCIDHSVRVTRTTRKIIRISAKND